MTRGARVESVHAAAACVTDDAGAVVLALGDVEEPVFLRSAAKPFIAAAAVQAGVVERFGFGDRELAVISASHNGEPGHVELVAEMLARIGASPADLRCGVHPPTYEPAAAALAAHGAAPTPLHHNCSGKHAGILAIARALGAPLDGYLDPGHPAERAVLAMCERITGDRLDGDRIAVDGCGVPVFATSLRRAAGAFARFATLRGLDDADAAALRRVRDAIAAEPWYLAGTGRFDTDLVTVTGARIVGKAGAEGVHADAWIAGGRGIAVKVIDGTRRAVPAATLAVLDAIGALDARDREGLAGHAATTVTNHAGRVVGEIRPRDGWATAGRQQPTRT